MWGYWEQHGDAWELQEQHWKNVQNKFKEHMWDTCDKAYVMK